MDERRFFAKRPDLLEQGWSKWSVDELTAAPAPLFAPCAVALGTFDGVHAGHRRILEDACALARDIGGVPIAFTFDRHPQETIAPQRAPQLLTSFDKRLELIRASGVFHTVVAEFDRRFAEVDAAEFLEAVVLGALGAKAVIVGYNFRFGRGAAGDASFLSRAARELGFQLLVVPPVQLGGEPVSSTRIRRMLEAGDVDAAASLLGRPYTLAGRVTTGDARGRALGFPTANLDPEPGVAIPGDGVYITEIRVRGDGAGNFRPGLTVIGRRPSFGVLERTIESFLLDFSGDLYGAGIEIDFLTRLRDVVKFETVDALKDQIAEDVTRARAYFAQTGGERSGSL